MSTTENHGWKREYSKKGVDDKSIDENLEGPTGNTPLEGDSDY